MFPSGENFRTKFRENFSFGNSILVKLVTDADKRHCITVVSRGVMGVGTGG
jgi:hypothetical protein